MPRLTLLVAALAALLLAAAPAAGARKLPHGFYGVMTDGVLMTQGDEAFAREFAVMRSTGVETVRPVVYWADMQPERGGPVMFGSLDRLMGEAARNGLDVIPVVLRAPSWARVEPGNFASPPKDPADFAAFLTALIGRYGPDGSFWAEHPDLPRRPQRDWQVWNEPNLDRYWSSPKPFAKDFVKLQRVAYAAIKQADPGARVILAGFGNDSWNAFRAAYDAGLTGRMYDVAAAHPFTGKVKNVMKIVRFNREVMRENGDGRKPMIVTEITWPAAKGTEATTTAGYEVTPKEQAVKLTDAYRAFIRNRKRFRLERVIWSTWLTTDCCSHNSFDWSGLRKIDPRKENAEPVDKPAFFAFRKLALAAQR
ncbi:MAG TPA: hypothetical protein VFR97_05620 [Capillimicrobium sp.]|nr:hypothetical protein [Capillimicrobium sp.]